MLLLLALACRSEPAPPAAPAPAVAADRPDVLVVVLDTVRADALSIYGNERVRTPALAALAARGTVYEDATAPGSWTWPNHASLFTGSFPWEHGAHFTRPDQGALVLNDAIDLAPLMPALPTLAERFAGAGYRTVAVSGNYMLDPRFGLTRGFERVAVKPDDDAAVVDLARGVMAEEDPRPLFLFVNLFAAHAPYPLPAGAPVPAWLAPYARDGAVRLHGRPSAGEPSLVMDHATGALALDAGRLALLRGLYEAEVETVDGELGALLAAWEAAPALDGVIAVAADHGEAFGEHDQLEHCRTVWPAVTRVPLVLSVPGRLSPGQRVETPVQLHDLYDTLLDAAGIGGGLRALASEYDGPVPDHPVLAAAWPHSLWVRELGEAQAWGWRQLRRGDEVLVTRHAMVDGAFGPVVEARLYDHAADPDLAHPLDRPVRVRALLAEHPALFGVEARTGALPTDPETVARLRELGYLGEADGGP